MALIHTIHTLLSNTVWMFFLLIGIWGLYRGIRRQGIDGNYLGATAIGQVLFFIQGALGITLAIAGNRPTDSFMHWLYGTFSLVFLPFVYLVWMRGEDDNQAQWVLAFATLFMFGIALRSITTGAG
ncbi:MAG: hypothetical protein KC415_14415 [Anaerolineales bacterium]|nr:hypothetical protein [Anaerolineales bacterium]MCB8991072.1 hypothetical protein [Ardenticatenaceae bacterium]MCB9004114.1 hypothetical protein [Ardenticatenaceae bacterium]